MKPIPFESQKLIEELDKLFPAFNPEPYDKIEYVYYKAGQRSVIMHLLERVKQDELRG
jgi:hypothetical protein